VRDRRAALAAVSRSLGRRDLIWGGLRADDIEALSDLEQVAGSFSIIGGHDRGGAIPSLLDFEDLSGVRVDLDSWDIEDHLGEPAAHEFRETILARLAAPTALLPYRSSAFLSSILFARRDRCIDLGLFSAHQAMFEHKPWVETELAALSLPRVPWVYVADEEQSIALRMLRDGPIMLRVSRSSGGTGLVRVDDPDLLRERWPHRPDAYASVAPFLVDVLPINIGATVWRNGVTMHHPSVQLIGIPGCAIRPFGYCGNDFGLATELEDPILDSIESSVLMIGRWLRRHNYLGTFGVDFLVHRGTPLFAEVNARFQGSTHASSQLSSEAGESCVLLDHLSAVLGHDMPRTSPLREWFRKTPPLAHLVVHCTAGHGKLGSVPLASLRTLSTVCRTDLVAKPGVAIEAGGVIARVTARDRMTTTGFELRAPWDSLVSQWVQSPAENANAISGG
jgi:hypothetical protein